MPRPSREKKPEQQPSAPSVAPATAPGDVRVPADGPGTVAPPTGTFGPPPVVTTPVWRAPETGPDEPKTLRPDSLAVPDAYAAPARKPASAPWPVPVAETEAKEPPVREFDSVAEAVLAPGSGSVSPGGPVAGPLARISEAVRQGRIAQAAGMAEQAVAETSGILGADHPDVLRLRELTAYIAYLAGDALRSFHLSLDLARLRHRLRDPRGAYGNVQSAAAAWRAVRDPLQGLHLGRDLIGIWREVAAAEGPAADDLEQLERARARMVRLAERARVAAAGHSHVR
ncbi:hypothetical protein [Streptomyces sp. NPDC001020]